MPLIRTNLVLLLENNLSGKQKVHTMTLVASRNCAAFALFRISYIYNGSVSFSCLILLSFT